MKSRKLSIASFSASKYTCIYSEMVEESPEVLHEGMTSKKRFLDELSLPSSILLHISIYIYYFLPFRELKPNHFISSLEKKKKEKNQIKIKPYSSCSHHIYTYQCFFPCNPKLITRFQDPGLNINHILLSGSFTLYKFWKLKLEFLVRPN